MANEQHAPQRFKTPPAVLDPANGVALYVQLADIFRYQILSGAWPQGHRMDNYDKVAAHYTVARITVRQAVARLVQEGLVTTQRGVGTIVCALPRQQRPPKGEIAFRFIYKGKANALPAEFQGDFLAYDRYRELTKVNVMIEQPIAMLRIFIAEDMYRMIPPRAIEKTQVLRLLLAHAPEAAEKMRHRITVEPADIVVAQHLQCSVGAPVAKILRQVHGADRRLSYAGISWHRGDTFEMDMILPRELIDDSSPALMVPGTRQP